MDPELWELLEEGDSGDEIAAIVRLGQPGILPEGVRVVAQFGDIATLRMERGKIQAVRAEEGVTSLKAPEPHGFGLAPDLEFDPVEPAEGLSEAEPWIYERRPPSLPETGRDVFCGFVDWGFDFKHLDFRHEDGRTRILALWDQRPPPSPGSPQPYGYGIVYSAEDINLALAAEDPYAALGYYPADAEIGLDGGTHGTHVASIAAGNGRGCGLAGVAPEADLVFVHLSTWDRTEFAKLGDSVTLLEAVHFIISTADQRPWVINLSMGRCGEQHDGTTPVEQGLDAALRAAPGGCIVQSCGNYFQSRVHASGQLRPAEERTLVWEIEDADITPNKLEAWYSGRDVFDVEIRSPDGSISAYAALGERTSLTADGRDIGTLYHRRYDPNALDNHIVIILYTGGPTGPWELTLIGKDVTDGRFHCWIERDSKCPPCQSRFRPEDAVPSSTTGTICNGFRTIAVGAYNPHSAGRELGPFSSAGKTRDGRLKPDCIAPGKSILAARSSPRDPRTELPPWTLMSGTSMAAPHVAGTVACMFQAAGRHLRIEETHNLLLANTERVTGPEEVRDRVGSGYLDITRAVEATRRIGSGAPQLQRSLYRETEGVAVNRQDTISSVETFDQESFREVSESNQLDDLDVAEFEDTETAEETLHDDDRDLACEKSWQELFEEDDKDLGLAELDDELFDKDFRFWPQEEEENESPWLEHMMLPEISGNEINAGDEREFGRELVELADEVISTGKVHSPGALLTELLSKAGVMAPARPLGAEHINPISPAALFDVFTSNKHPELREYFNQFFEVVALPCSRIDNDLQSGDCCVRRGLGEGDLAHVFLLVTGEVFQVKELASMGLRPESRRPGLYAEVIDAGPCPHRLEDMFARRLGDDGQYSYDSLFFRIRQSDRPRGSRLIEAAENDAAEAAPTVLFHLFKEWHARAPASMSYSGPTADDRRVVENPGVGGGLIAKARLHLCFLEKAVDTLSVDVGSDVVHAKWEILDASGTVVREHPRFTAANHAAGAAAARLVTAQHAWLWDARNNAANPVFVPAGRYRSRVTMTPQGGTSTTHETAIDVEGSPYSIQIYGEPKTDAELTTLFAGIRLLNTRGERITRDCWITVHRGATDLWNHTVFLGQGTIEATTAEGAPGFGAIATPRTKAFKAWIRRDPRGVEAKPDRIQIQSLGRTDEHVDLTNPRGPSPVNPFTDELPHGPFKDGVQAHAGNVTGVTTNGMSVGCTTASALTGTCAAPSSVLENLRSINSSFGTWGSGTGSERVWKQGPPFVNKQSKRTTSLDALVADDHTSPLLDPLAPPGCGAAHDEPLHMQPTMQQAVFGGYLGHEIPRFNTVADEPVNQLRIRMALGAYASGSKYHQYHHAVAFGHEAAAVGAGFRFTIWVPRKIIRSWNGNRRNVLVRGFCDVSWTIEHLVPGASSATTVANLIGGTALGSFVDLPEVGRLQRPWTPTLPLAPGAYTSVFKYKLELKPFVTGVDVWLADLGGADTLSGQGATLALETLRTAGTQQFVDGDNRLRFRS